MTRLRIPRASERSPEVGLQRLKRAARLMTPKASRPGRSFFRLLSSILLGCAWCSSCSSRSIADRVFDIVAIEVWNGS